jgi:hypothetical protein
VSDINCGEDRTVVTGVWADVICNVGRVGVWLTIGGGDRCSEGQEESDSGLDRGKK